MDGKIGSPRPYASGLCFKPGSNMLVRAILPRWALEETPGLRKVLEGDFSDDELVQLNAQGYNIHHLPNGPSMYSPDQTVDGSHIDQFNYVFVDMDLKEGKYASKDVFIERVLTSEPHPTRIVDSGNGVHVYWHVSDLDAMSYLKLQRRLMRLYDTDEAVAKIFQLMRPTGFYNTKAKDDFKLVEEVYASDASYTCEALDALLPPLTQPDQVYCQTHYDKTYNIKDLVKDVNHTVPDKFKAFVRSNQEAKDLWAGNTDDRSKADYRLGHLMHAHGFLKAEAISVLVNSAKALQRAPIHRVTYATGIVDKIWTFEDEQSEESLDLSSSVRAILSKGEDTIKGMRFPGPRYLDATKHGFRLGQVIGLVAGSGVGKTAVALNMFMEFVKKNPDYIHFFIPLEQPANEIADRWRSMCGTNTSLHDKVHVISNYADDGSFRHLSLTDIREYLLKFQRVTKQKVGCVVIDHIGALKKQGKDGENQGIMDICHEMKAFAISTNTLMVMQSQSSREKAGIGDLELNKDAAYGTVYFESYCDYLVTIWQPLKRVYSMEKCPTVTAFKFCKIRHKKAGQDEITEDTSYRLFYDPNTELLRDLTQDEEKNFDFYDLQARNARKKDRKVDAVVYQSVTWTKDGKGYEEQKSKASDSGAA